MFWQIVGAIVAGWFLILLIPLLGWLVLWLILSGFDWGHSCKQK